MNEDRANDDQTNDDQTNALIQAASSIDYVNHQAVLPYRDISVGKFHSLNSSAFVLPFVVERRLNSIAQTCYLIIGTK